MEHKEYERGVISSGERNTYGPHAELRASESLYWCSDLENQSNSDLDVKSYISHEADNAAYLVTWTHDNQHANPRTWSRRYRMFLVFLVSCYTVLSPLSSTSNVPALDKLSEQLHVKSYVIGNMMMSAPMLAFVIAPSFYAPLSEQFGRKHILIWSNIAYVSYTHKSFLLFNVFCGLAQDKTQMIVLRFFSGMAGVAPVAIGPGIVADLFEPEERGSAMAMYTLSPILGPCIGPIYAGWIIQAYGEKKWPWIFYVSTMFGALVAVLGFIFLRETFIPVILEKETKKVRNEKGQREWHTVFTNKDPLRTRIIQGLFRPFIFLATQPVVLVTCLYQGLMFGCQYLLLASFSRLFKDSYEQPPGLAGMHYFSMVIGFLISGIIGGKWVDWNYQRLKMNNGGIGKPEFKLPFLFVTGIVMPVGLLLYGWTAEYHLHWLAPDAGIFILSWGLRATMFICPLYLADAVTMYAASASSAGIITRGLFAFTFPLFAPNMYEELGQGWGNSLLALATLLIGIPAPLLLYRSGETLRSHSSYSKHAMSLIS